MYFAAASPKHVADEEESLFPRLRQSSDPAAAEGLEMLALLEEDHHRANERHRAVEALAQRWLERGVLDPSDAQALRDHLSALRALYEPHIAVEERELFPAAARLLSADELAQIGCEMAKRRSRRG
jgi:hemerythrin-like domain-containing protein